MSVNEPASPPTVNTLVDLLPAGHETWLPSRVEDDAPGTVVVAAPPVPVEAGQSVRVFWKGAWGPLELPTTVVEARRAAVPVWVLRAAGPPERASRREFFRVQLTAPVRIRAEEELGPATLVDLSEGGLRCHLRTDDGRLAAGTEVDVAIELGEDVVALAAEVVRRLAHDLGVDVSLRFLEVPAPAGDVIRHHLFAEQRRLRANGLL